MLGVIGLDAADVRRLLRHEDLHEFRQTGFELCGCLEWQTPTDKTTDKNRLGRDEGKWMPKGTESAAKPKR